MERVFRTGNIGALMDEYERAAAELRSLVGNLSEDDFVKILDTETEDEDCRSVQTIIAHVVGAGYSYADYIRELFAIASERPPRELFPPRETAARLDALLEYTVRTLEGRWVMSDDEIANTVIRSRWGVTYDIEQLLEHAVVHLLRHRRQIERLIRSQN
jgi:uncharacterized damage-inducible protein DinB